MHFTIHWDGGMRHHLNPTNVVGSGPPSPLNDDSYKHQAQNQMFLLSCSLAGMWWDDLSSLPAAHTSMHSIPLSREGERRRWKGWWVWAGSVPSWRRCPKAGCGSGVTRMGCAWHRAAPGSPQEPSALLLTSNIPVACAQVVNKLCRFVLECQRSHQLLLFNIRDHHL